jgi:hypothetical protein
LTSTTDPLSSARAVPASSHTTKAVGISNLCASLVDLGFGSQARVLEYERDRTAVQVDL